MEGFWRLALVKGDRWHVKCNTWHLTPDKWHLTPNFVSSSSHLQVSYAICQSCQSMAGTRQGKEGINRDKQGQSLSVPACPCLSLSFPACPCLSLSVHVCPLSLSVPVCLFIGHTCISPADEYHSIIIVTLTLLTKATVLVHPNLILNLIFLIFFWFCSLNNYFVQFK